MTNDLTLPEGNQERTDTLPTEAMIDFFHENDWEIVHSLDTDERDAGYKDYSTLNLSGASKAVLSSFREGIYGNKPIQAWWKHMHINQHFIRENVDIPYQRH